MGLVDFFKSKFGASSDTGVLKERDIEHNSYFNFRDPLSKYYHENTAVLNERSKIYKDMDDLDNDIISTVLDMGADDATQMDLNTGKSLWCKSTDVKYEKIINDFFDRIKIEEKIWRWAREIYKYGDFFLGVKPGEGRISSVDDTSFPERYCRIENNGTLVSFLDLEMYHQFPQAEALCLLPPYSIVHFRTPRYRVKEDLLPAEIYQRYEIDRNPLYGSSTFLKARKIEKRISLINDALALTRLARSTVYRIHSINVGDLTSVNQRQKIMKDYENTIRKAPGINLGTDKANVDVKNLSFFRELFIPRDNEGKGQSEINDIGGNVDVTGIADIDYLNSQRFGVLGVPKAYLSFDEAQSFNSLIALDTRYARKIVSLQKSLISGLTALCQIELALHNIEPDLSKFSIHLVPVSTNGELDRNDALNAIIDICNNIKTFFDQDNIDKDYVLKYLVTNYLRFPNFDLESLFKPEGAEDLDTDESLEKRIDKVIDSSPILKEKIDKFNTTRHGHEIKASSLDLYTKDQLAVKDKKLSYNSINNLKKKSNTIGDDFEDNDY